MKPLFFRRRLVLSGVAVDAVWTQSLITFKALKKGVIFSSIGELFKHPE